MNDYLLKLLMQISISFIGAAMLTNNDRSPSVATIKAFLWSILVGCFMQLYIY